MWKPCIGLLMGTGCLGNSTTARLQAQLNYGMPDYNLSVN